MRPPLLASATSLNFIAEVVNGLSLPTIVASLRVTVCAGAALGWSSAAAVRNATKHFIGVLVIYPPVRIQSPWMPTWAQAAAERPGSTFKRTGARDDDLRP